MTIIQAHQRCARCNDKKTHPHRAVLASERIQIKCPDNPPYRDRNALRIKHSRSTRKPHCYNLSLRDPSRHRLAARELEQLEPQLDAVV
jgi:hypothetical protein